MVKNQFKKIKIGITFVICFIFVVLLFYLNLPQDGVAPTSASKLIFVRAHVTQIVRDNALPDTWTEGLRLGTQEVYIMLDSGDYKGEELAAVNYLNAYSNLDLKEGLRIIVRLDYDDQGFPFVAAISNYNRDMALMGLALLFIVLLVLLGGKKGISAVLGLAFTVICIWFFLIPLLQRGAPTIASAVALVAITTSVSLLLLNGFSPKTLCATIGCVGGVAIAGICAAVAGWLTSISGFNMPEAEELILRAADNGMKIRGLFVSGVLIASLGAVMDVAMTITSAVFELHRVNPRMARKELFQSGLIIGRDAMGTMANTLILAFSGSSLNILILFRVFDYPYLQVFNSDLMALEVIQGLAGSIGIVLTVPLIAALSATMSKSSVNVK